MTWMDNRAKEKLVDPVVPDQAGRMTPADPGHVIPKSEEDIRRRAYAIYESRGKREGNALEDWLTAEATCEAKP